MSRIGRAPIPVPSGVEVKIDGSKVSVKGKNGELNSEFHNDMTIVLEDGILKVSRPSDEQQHRALHGLTRSLLNNMVIGVSDGYERVYDFRPTDAVIRVRRLRFRDQTSINQKFDGAVLAPEFRRRFEVR